MMSSSSERKLKERELLIKRVFPTPYAQAESSQLLFRVCRERGGPYCSRFKENGFTEKFEPFKNEEVIVEATKMLADEDLLKLAAAHKTVLNSWQDFKGEYYTYDCKSRSFRIGSVWPSMGKDLVRFREKYGNEGMAVLSAIVEVNVEHDKRWKNYYMVMTLAKEKGLGKGVVQDPL
jgi:hypothetical protein